MAKFYVGQRVKRIRTRQLWNPRTWDLLPVRLGAEGVIRRLSLDVAWVEWGGQDQLPAFYWTLAPLTDPKADAFIEQVKRWKPEPLPVPVGDEQPALSDVLRYYRSLQPP